MSNLNSNLEALFGKLENFVTTKTVVGEPIHIGNVILLPLVDVSFGVGAGVYDSNAEKDNKESGGGGLGANITPTAVLVINDGNVQLVNVKNQDSINKLIDMVPGVLSKLNIPNIFKQSETKAETKAESVKPAEEPILKSEIFPE